MSKGRHSRRVPSYRTILYKSSNDPHLTTRRRACIHARMVAAKRHSESTQASDNTPARVVEKEPLQVRIPVTVKRRFKSHAALRGMEPNELFVEVWERYEASLASEATKDGGI